MIPRSHPLASVSEAYNAVFVEAESAGRLMFYGAGAGGGPTASAVLGDLVAVARKENGPSLRIMEKIGMSYERDQTHRNIPVVLYSMTKSHWLTIS